MIDSARQSLSSAAAMMPNVGCGERMVSIAGGWLLLSTGLRTGGLVGVLGAFAGGMLVARGITGQCALRRALQDQKSRAAHSSMPADISASQI